MIPNDSLLMHFSAVFNLNTPRSRVNYPIMNYRPSFNMGTTAYKRGHLINDIFCEFLTKILVLCQNFTEQEFNIPDMNQVFLILAHKKPKQLVALLKQLEDPKSFFYVHLDLKCNIIEFEEETKSVRNLKYIQERYDVGWGSITIVMATLALIKALEAEKNLEYTHAHLISGEDILIKPREEFFSFFSGKQGINFLSCSKLPRKGWWRGGMDRIAHYHFGKSKRVNSLVGRIFRRLYNYIFIIFPFIKKRLLEGIEYYGGSAWWSLTPEGINYILKYTDSNPAYVSFYKYSLLPDEIFFQTLIMNSYLIDSVDSDSKRFTIWRPEDKGSPAWLRESDYDTLRNSAALFARKVNFDDSAKLYKMFG